MAHRVLRKVAILMTDGGYNAFRSGKEQDQQTVSDYAKDACTAMKAKGIEIYTVGFALNELTAAEGYHSARNPAELWYRRVALLRNAGRAGLAGRLQVHRRQDGRIAAGTLKPLAG